MLRMRRTGFTLMEIMVVIIVIAVLASVAGPMVNNITEQGRQTATKSTMANLKTALTQYVADCTRYPHTGDSYSATNINNAMEILNTTEGTNILFNLDATCTGWTRQGYNTTTWKRRWKGPYMETTPDDYMMDAWQNRLRYKAAGKMIYLWSAGTDGSFCTDTEFETAAGNEAYANQENDDIIMAIGRWKK